MIRESRLSLDNFEDIAGQNKGDSEHATDQAQHKSKVPPPKVVAWSNAPRRCDITQLAKQMSLLRFSFVFFLVLPFHVLADSFFIQSDGTYTVAS